MVVVVSQLLIRNVPDAWVERLQRRAVEHGVSVEVEHLHILAEALSEGTRATLPGFKEHLEAMPEVGEDWMFDTNDPRHRIPASEMTDFIAHLLSPEGKMDEDLLLPPEQNLRSSFDDEASGAMA